MIMPGTELVQSLSRGLNLLRLIAESGDGLTLAQVVERSGLKGPTAHNLLRTLSAEGFVERLASPRRYRLGPAVGELAESAQRRLLLRRATRLIVKLQGRFPLVRWSLAESSGDEVVTVLRASPERPGLVERPARMVMPPYSSATSLLFQAYWPSEVRAAYQRRYPLAEYGLHLWRSPERLDDFLRRVRRRGVSSPSWSAGVPDVGAIRLAVPVFSSGGQMLASVGAYVAREHLPSGGDDRLESRLARTLKTAAGRLVHVRPGNTGERQELSTHGA